MLGPHFPPDTAPTGVVLGRIVEELAHLGHEIEVVTSLPWYRDHAIEGEWQGHAIQRELTGWGRITRVHPFPADKGDLLRRGLAFIGFTGLAGTVAGSLDRVDAVVAMSPPLTLGAAAIGVGRRHRAPVVFNVQDIFPDVAVELGAITNPRLIAAAQRLERWSYQHSDAVTVLSDELAQNVEAKAAGRTRVCMIPNFVDTVAITPMDRMTDYRIELGLADETVVLYAGNVGFSQSLEMVIECARRLSGRSDLTFVINGSGSARASLERSAEGLTNVRFGEFQPAERLGEVLATGDIHVVPLKTGLARSSVPSKSYSVMAAGRPLLASVDPGTEVARMAERTGAGLAVAPDDADALCDALVQMADDPVGRARMGAAGRAEVLERASPAAVGAAYDQLLGELVTGRSRRR